MEISEVARCLGTRVLQPGLAPAAEARRAVSSDRMSDLLERAAPTTLVITALATTQLLHMAEIMEVPAVCVAAASPGADFVACAMRSPVPVIVSPLERGEIERRLSCLLDATGEADR